MILSNESTGNRSDLSQALVMLLMCFFQANHAVQTDRSQNQSVNLGDLSARACLTIPESCGSTGGALSVWVKIEDCSGDGGIISSNQIDHEGFQVKCIGHYL